MEKLISLLGENNQLVVMKGQLRNIEKKVKDTGEVYYVGDLRVPRVSDDDVYSVGFNILNICFSNAYVSAKNITDAQMKQLKDNEVTVLLSLVSGIFVNKSGDNTYKNNRVLFYVEDHQLTRQVEQHNYKTKSYNI